MTRDRPRPIPGQLDPRRWKALALLCTAFFMVILDSAIVLVALPSINADLAFAAGDLQWVLSAYMLSFGGLLLLGGRAADLLGRRRMFIVGTGLFALASLGAGLAGSAAALLTARAVQGVAAAIMTPTALSIVMTTFPEGAERNMALGIWGSTGAVAGTGLFALASLGAGLAGTSEALLAARVVQGVAAAIMTPTALSIVMTTFPEGGERNKALGIWGSTGAIGGTAAWLVGGPITDGLGWEWIFFINVPVAAVVAGVARVLLG